MAYTPENYLKSQQKASQISSVAGGVSSLFGQYMSMENEGKNINTTAPESQTDFLGRPVYNLGQFLLETSAIKPQGAKGGEVAGGALSGASAGAAFGPVGAGIGAGIGALTALIGGRRRKKLQQRKQRTAQANLFAAQQLYNKALEGFNITQTGKNMYNTNIDQQQRVQNLYEFNNG